MVEKKEGNKIIIRRLIEREIGIKNYGKLIIIC